ncbi:hypothetical protein LR48_Vigan845s003000 [Vigna angularis]|uniref:Uncharacterized protein n=1 Tax=Phaseolus angularis TaxID=3914 RepID=A0A0L9THV9_PHAAN|nr:hypothetical protein LR48_Vigan845s003000 [Vigna angularis]
MWWWKKVFNGDKVQSQWCLKVQGGEGALRRRETDVGFRFGSSIITMFKDSRTEEYEETEEEFLKRYAKAAEALENGSVIEEGTMKTRNWSWK